MKRRDFIAGLSGAAATAATPSLLASPCSPDLAGSTGAPVCPVPVGVRDLAQDAAQINPGEWLFSINLPSNVQRFDVSWQNRTAYWDDINRELQFMGKAQGGGAARHFIYSDSSRTWRSSSLDIWRDMGSSGGTVPGGGLFGHVWINSFDHSDDPGDYYYFEQDPVEGVTNRRFRVMDRSVEAGQGSQNDPWRYSSNAPFDIWNTRNTPNPGLVYHPNLRGPGQPGVFVWGTGQFSIWDKSNDEWIQVATFSPSDTAYGDRNTNVSLYVPGHDIALFGSSRNGSQVATIIPASYNTNDSTPRQESLPIEVSGGASNSSAHLLLDPRDNGTIMLLERGGDRVWTNAEGGLGSAWQLESYRHPFWDNLPVNRSAPNFGSWTPCSIPRYGVVLGLASHDSASNNGEGGTIMWRPG